MAVVAIGLCIAFAVYMLLKASRRVPPTRVDTQVGAIEELREAAHAAIRGAYRQGVQDARSKRPDYRPEWVDSTFDEPPATASWITVHELLSGIAPGELQICFTGFGDVLKPQLQARARAAGFVVRSSVSKHLTLLCVGPTAGPQKLLIAGRQHVALIDRATFERLAREGWD